MATYYLGLSTSGHDPALALVDEGGRVIFAEATERFVQDKRAWGIAPDHVNHLEHALKAIGFDWAKDDLRVASSWPVVKAEIPVQVSNAMLPATDGMWLRSLQAQAQTNAGASLLRLGLATEMPNVLRFDHHLCHAVAACYQSPFQDADCLVVDGEGEVGAVSMFDIRGRSLKRRWRSWGPGSLGTFYAWLTMLCGFDWRLGEEWKVMGLAAYGQVLPDLAEALKPMLLVQNGRLRFAEDAVVQAARAAAIPHARDRSEPLMKAADLAATGQAVYGYFLDQIVGDIRSADIQSMVLTGGCALNSSYNGTIAGRLGYDRVFVPSAPADDGNAVGAAVLAWMLHTGAAAIPASDGSPFLGSTASGKTLDKVAASAGGLKVTDVCGHAAQAVAQRIAAGQIMGVMRGRAEFGPRALGNRSIIADPRPADMKDRINRLVKGREPYRPFAPVVLAEDAENWFERAHLSPYMSFTQPWKASVRSRVPAVVHEDGSGRLQTVDSVTSSWMTDLVQHFGQITETPVLLNTSLNIMGKPIVHSVEDALGMLVTSGLDAVLIEDLLVEKP